MRKALILTILLAVLAFAYNEVEIKTIKKAYKKVTIEYFDNEDVPTEPCSTITTWYGLSSDTVLILIPKGDSLVMIPDPNYLYIPIHREFKKGCCNPIRQGGMIFRIPEDSLWFGATLDTITITDSYELPHSMFIDVDEDN